MFRACTKTGESHIGVVPLSLESSVFPTRSCSLHALEQQVAQHSGIGMLHIPRVAQRVTGSQLAEECASLMGKN